MTIYVFGNPEIEADSLPIKILPKIKENFPEINFEIKDPNEEWNVPEELIIIDTVLGIDDVKIFDDLKYFSGAPKVSLHDFDAYANLRYLQKLGRLKKIKIIGVPPMIDYDKAVQKISNLIFPS